MANGSTRYRQLQAPVIPDVISQDTGAAQAAMELSDALTSFSREGFRQVAGIRSEQGAQEGAAAGIAGTPQPRQGLRANTAYGRAYNSSAEAAYAAKMQTDIDAELTKYEQDYEGNLQGFNEVTKGYGDKLLASVLPEYRPRVQEVLNARAAAGAARVRGQQLAYEREAHRVAVLEGMQARQKATLDAVDNLDRDAADAALTASVAENKAQLDSLVADHTYSASEALKLQEEYVKGLDDGLFALRVSPVVENMMNAARVDVTRGDKMLAAYVNNGLIPEDERAQVRAAYDKQRTALVEDRKHLYIDQTAALAQRVAADEAGSAVLSEAKRLQRLGAMSDDEYQSTVSKITENGLKHAEDNADATAAAAILASGQGLDPANAKHRQGLNKLFDKQVAADNLEPGSQRWMALVADVVKKTNILPDAAESYARVNILSQDPLKAAQGAAMFARVQEVNPAAWDYNSDPKIAAAAEQINANISAGIDPQRSYDTAVYNVYGMKKEEKELLESGYGKRKDVLAGNFGSLVGVLDDDPKFNPPGWQGAPEPSLAMQAEYNRLVGQFYTMTNGNIESARKLAGNAIRSTWGTHVRLDGTREVMKFAPVRAVPGLTDDVVNEDMLKAVASVPGPQSVMYPKSLRLVPESTGGTARTKGLWWNIGYETEEGYTDVVRGPDNRPLPYHLPVGQDFLAIRDARRKEELDKAIADRAEWERQQQLYHELTSGPAVMGGPGLR